MKYFILIFFENVARNTNFRPQCLKKLNLFIKTKSLEYLSLDIVVLVCASSTESNAKIRMKIGP